MESKWNHFFHKISMDDMAWMKQIESEMYVEACDYVFANNMMWAERYRTEVAYIEECFLVKYLIDGEIMFAYPMSGNSDKRIRCVKRLLEICHRNGICLKFTLITDTFKKELLDNFKGMFEIDAYRDGFDYVYERERLALLPGKKLASKRNHIHRFREKGSWNYEPIDASNMEECWAFEVNWVSKQTDEDKQSLMHECHAIRFAFDHYTELGLVGGAIRQNGKIVAFTVGEQLNCDTLVVHFEKADGNVQGAYQIINQQFAEHHPEYKYFNREDDTGDLGLRKSKMSYHPDLLVRKYMAVRSEFSYATEEDFEDIIFLWQTCFGDSRPYIEFYLSNMFKEDNILCLRRDGKVVSMASIFPAEIRYQDASERILYLYGVATLPEYRRKGMATSIIEHIYRKFGCSIVLCPENRKVEKFYKNMGFERAFQGQTQTGSCCADIFGEDFSEITDVTDSFAASYLASRESRFYHTTYIAWDIDYLRYALEEHIKTGGKVVQCFDGYVLFKVSDHEIVVAENTASAEYEQAVFEKLTVMYGKQSIAYGKCVGLRKKSMNGGAITWDKGYLALTLG